MFTISLVVCLCIYASVFIMPVIVCLCMYVLVKFLFRIAVWPFFWLSACSILIVVPLL